MSLNNHFHLFKNHLNIGNRRQLFPQKWILINILALFLFLDISCVNSNTTKPPNIIFILADDLGYGELGSYGQLKIETPHIDMLAADGMKLTNYYSGSPVCAPSRCILLTGMHSGHAYIRGNDEVDERGNIWDYRDMANNPGLEGQYPLADSIETIAELLKDSGYKTALFGKWGLGYPGSESTPNKQGFDYFFGYNCQRQAHTLTPLHLWRNEEKTHLRNDTIPPKTKLDKGDDPFAQESYYKYQQPDYAPQLIYEDLHQYVKNTEEPFALFWETPIPHVPLQAPKEWVDYYVKKFGDEPPYVGDKGYFPCRYPNATYAAMISYFDENVGRLIKLLKEKEIYENTVILFTSDNGPTYAGGVDAEYFNSAGPFREDYGWGKGFLKEGGIRVPLIISWPNMINKGAVSEVIASAQDIFPTISDLADLDNAEPKVDGISLVPTLLGNRKQTIRNYLYWEYPEYGGQCAVRIENWKGYIDSLHFGKTEMQLFNLANDPTEQTNMAKEHPQVISEMIQIMSEEHKVSQNPKWQIEFLDQLK